MSKYKIAVVVGSLRKDSFNRKLASAIVKLALSEFSFEQVEIGDLPDCLDAPVPFDLDIHIRVLCLECSLHLVKRLEEAACRYYIEDNLFMTCFLCDAARTQTEHPDEHKGNH